jgi:proline dehydrogenase
MFRSILLSLSGSKSARSFITWFPLSRSVSKRFVAGEQLYDITGAVADLKVQGLQVTIDHLGENVSNEEEATKATLAYLSVLDAMDKAGLKSHVSVKLTQFGMDLSDDICISNLRRVAERAKALNTFVRVDMESSEYTDRTLEAVRIVRRMGYDNVGVVIQAYLFRSAEDITQLCKEGIRVRLCKGAYKEPPDKAFPNKADVDANYIKLANMLLDASRDDTDLYPALATHDEAMITSAKQYARLNEISVSAFEFQMLYGIRRDLQEQLLKDGYNVRVYVPYGSEWYPYFMRRLAERPANLWFFITNFFKR